MTLEAGELDTRATFFKKTSKQSPESGRVLDEWERMASRWIKFTALTYRNTELGKGFSAATTHEGKLDYYGDLTNGCKAVINGRDYYVSGFFHDSASRPKWTNVFFEAAS